MGLVEGASRGNASRKGKRKKITKKKKGERKRLGKGKKETKRKETWLNLHRYFQYG